MSAPAISPTPGTDRCLEGVYEMTRERTVTKRTRTGKGPWASLRPGGGSSSLLSPDVWEGWARRGRISELLKSRIFLKDMTSMGFTPAGIRPSGRPG